MGYAEKNMKCVKYWKRTYILLRTIFPLFKLYQLSNSDKPSMNKMYYYTNQPRSSLKKNKGSLDNDTLPDIFWCDHNTDWDTTYVDSYEGWRTRRKRKKLRRIVMAHTLAPCISRYGNRLKKNGEIKSRVRHYWLDLLRSTGYEK